MRTDLTLALAAGLTVFALPVGAKRAAPGWQHQTTTDRDDVCEHLPAGV
jgi:hypothetical protein